MYVYANKNEKAVAFEIILDATEAKYIKKGSVIQYKRRRCEVTAIRGIEVGNGIVKVTGKCIQHVE